MIPYKLDYTIEKVLENRTSPEQNLLKQLTGKLFAEDQAARLWKKVENHKWHISERLGRDVGMRVAAADYFENFYQPPSTSRTRNLMTISSSKTISLA